MRILKNNFGKSFAKNKKGSIFDILLLILLPMIFIILIVAVWIGYQKTAAALTDALPTINNGVVNATEANNSYSTVANSYPAYWDLITIFIIFGMWLGVIISAYLLGNNPIFLILYVVLSLAMLILAVYIQFAEQSIATTGGMDVYYASFPITSFFIQHSFVFSIFFILSVGIALYLKPQSQGQGAGV